MKKLKSKGGFTLVEMLATILILVFLILGIGTGMDSALTIYNEAKFEANSASMADIVNTSLGDILRYAYIRTPNEGESYFIDITNTKVPDVEFVFTNYEYGVRDAYFYLDKDRADGDGVLRLKNLNDSKEVELVNTGAYPKLRITDFSISYVPAQTNSANGGYYEINYTVASTVDSTLTKEVSYVVRSMNAQ